MYYWVLLPHPLDHEVGHLFEYVLLSFEVFTRTGPFYFSLITALAVFSVNFIFIAAAHDTRVDLEVDGSAILQIRNA